MDSNIPVKRTQKKERLVQLGSLDIFRTDEEGKRRRKKVGVEFRWFCKLLDTSYLKSDNVTGR